MEELHLNYLSLGQEQMDFKLNKAVLDRQRCLKVDCDFFLKGKPKSHN